MSESLWPAVCVRATDSGLERPAPTIEGQGFVVYCRPAPSIDPSANTNTTTNTTMPTNVGRGTRSTLRPPAWRETMRHP